MAAGDKLHIGWGCEHLCSETGKYHCTVGWQPCRELKWLGQSISNYTGSWAWDYFQTSYWVWVSPTQKLQIQCDSKPETFLCAFWTLVCILEARPRLCKLHLKSWGCLRWRQCLWSSAVWDTTDFRLLDVYIPAVRQEIFYGMVKKCNTKTKSGRSISLHYIN